MNARTGLKNLLGRLPLGVEAWWALRRLSGRPLQDHYKLPTLQAHMGESTAAARQAAAKAGDGRDVFIFSTLHYWIEHTTLLGLALAGVGQHVRLAFLPYSDWRVPVDRFDLRRRSLYTRGLLGQAGSLIHPVDLLQVRPAALPQQLQRQVEAIALFDTQYTLQIEDVDRTHPLYRLRLQRNEFAAGAALALLERMRPQVAVIPNGMVLEFGAVYAAAEYLGIPRVTYEFGDQSNRLWMAQNAQIMRHETGSLWENRKDLPLTGDQRRWLEEHFAARQTPEHNDSFARIWQESASVGGAGIRAALGLDDRPVVLFTTNVLGDSLTLGRQVFSPSMGDWITRLMAYFAGRQDVQLVIRIHPGENLTRGPSVSNLIRQALPVLPAHIHLIEPKEKINTYDLMEIAALGLVYTTTSGLEMAVRGLPVVVAGQTHYRGRGFTIDPASFEEYFAALDRILADPASQRLTPAQVDRAWNYAYRFFREFPRPFPWHIQHIAADRKARPLDHVLSPAGLAEYGSTLAQLAGEPLRWDEAV